MKCLHVVNISFVIPYYLGDQLNYFKSKGFSFDIACSPSDHLIEISKTLPFTPLAIPITRNFNILNDFIAIKKLFTKIRKNKYDIVIGHTPKGAMVAMIASFLARCPQRIYLQHGIMFETSSGFKKIVLKTVERLTAGCATKVVCVSPSVLKKSNEFGLGATKKRLILRKGTCNGIDISRFSPLAYSSQAKSKLKSELNIPEDRIVIGYVGRLVKDKGIEELIAAWKLIEKNKDAILLLVGPFEERDGLSSEVLNYIKAEPTVLCTGLVTDTAPLYSIMDVFILPSYREGFPTVVLEASAMELPVITTRSTGCIDSIIENITGIFTGLEANEIAKAILFYLSNDAARKEHGKAGRKFVQENFLQEDIWKEMESVIYDIK